jgi:hypothetical protein
MKTHFYKTLCFSFLFLLASCGAGLDQSVQGVAAVGAPLSNATIVLKDATGATRTTTADPNGRYAFSKSDLFGLKAPIQVSASVQMGEKLVTHFAVIPELKTSDVGNTANITPLTSAVTGLLSNSGILTDFTPAQLSQLTPEAYANANNKVKTAIAPLSTQLVGQTFDPLTTPITQTGKTADLLLDHLDVAVRSDSVSITNKMAVLGNSDPTTAASSQISKDPGTPATPIQVAEITSTEGFEELVAQFKKCFAIDSTARLTAKTKADATLHADCSDIAIKEGYLHNGTNFKVRWAKALNSSTIGTSAKFFMPEVRLRISKAPVERIAVNINFMDNSGSGYTVPEIIEKSEATGGKWRLRGNQRPINAYIEAQLDYYKDLSNHSSFVNTNFSRIASSLRIYLDPRVSFDPTTGAPDYSDAIDLRKSYGFAVSPSNPTTTTLKFSEFKEALAADVDRKNNHFVGCIVVTGPGKWSGSKWMGIYPNGIVLKRPNGSPTQDYVAIDKRLTSAQLSSVVASSAGTNYASRSLVNDLVCDDGTTNQSNSNYTIELEALVNQVHPFTGNVDTSINGRNVQWNTGPSYARVAPDASLAKEFDLNPNLTMYVITDAKKVALKLDVRYLGDLPPASQARELVEKNRVSIMSTDTLRSYLDFNSNSDTVKTVTTASAKWTTAPGAFGADLIGFYAQVYKSKPGRGLRGPNSVIEANKTATPDGIWTADEDLAAALDATGAGNDLPNLNFYWSWADYARPTLSDGSGLCYKANTTKPATLVTSTNAAVGRSDTSFTNRYLNGASYHGIDALSTACLNSDSTDTNRASDAYLHREVWMRTYTDRNVRVYVYTANKKFRSPS